MKSAFADSKETGDAMHKHTFIKPSTSLVLPVEPVSDAQAVTLDKARSSFERDSRPPLKPDKTPGRDSFAQGEDRAVLIQQNDIERVLHTEGVDSAAGFDPEHVVVFKRRQSQQPEGTFAGRICDEYTPRNRFLCFNVD